MPAIAADAGIVAIAIVALLVVLAVYFLLQVIVGFARWIGMPNWPLIGSTMFNAISGVAQWVGGVAAWLWQHANPVTIVVASVHWLINELNTVNAWVLTNVWGALYRVVTVNIPGAFGAAVNEAHILYNDAVAFATSEVNAVRTWVTGEVLYVEAVIASDISAARALTVQLYNDAITWTDQRVAIAEAAALGLVQSLQGWVVQELGALRTWVTGEIDATAQTLEGDISTGLHDLSQVLTPEIAAAAAVGAAAAAAFETWRKGCGDPLCNNLLSFGNIISSLEGLISDGVLIALIAGAVADPAGTATVIEQDFAAPVAGAVTTVLDAVGFRMQTAA